METFYSGLSFHLYCLDMDMDGYLDVIVPSMVANQLQYVRNPGKAYWTKVGQVKDRFSQFSRDRLQREIDIGVEKWK